MTQDTPSPAPDKDENLPEKVTEDVGGWQGVAPDEDDAETGAQGVEAVTPGSPPDQPAPDSGEIEWAGQVVKKPPTPE
jgi:hypothetical protein